MKKKLVSMILCLTMVTAMAVGCGNSDSGDSGNSGDNKEAEGDKDSGKSIKVGFAIKTQNGPYFVKLVESVEAEAEKKGWDCTVLTANEDTAKEAENIESFITQGMDVIFLDSIDPDACIPSIDAAAEAGIPVINLDSGVNGGNYVTTVYSDNKENGRLSGVAYADWMKDNGKEDEEIIAILLSGKKGNVAGLERRTGLFAGIVQGRTGCSEDEAWEVAEDIEDQLTSGGKAEYADAKFKIVGQGWGNWTEEDGLTACEDFVTANPDVTTILGENDQMLFGGQTALENAGIKGVAIVAAADGACAAFDLIKENDKADNPYIVSGLNSPVLVAQDGVRIAEEIAVDGASWDDYEQITLTEAAGVTKDLVDKYYDVGF
jgi:ribose transport system substrate-binding protein